MKKKVF